MNWLIEALKKADPDALIIEQETGWYVVDGKFNLDEIATERDRLREALAYIANWRSDQTSPQSEYARAALEKEAGK